MGLLFDVLLISFLALVINLVFHWLRQPSIIGYILTGLLVGPHILGWISYASVEIFAQVGIVLLMFTLGIEFSFDKIKQVKRVALGGGSLQVVLSILVGVATAPILGWSWYQGIYLGCLVAMSSSAIVVKLMLDAGELDTLHGRVTMGMTLFHDLAAIPMMIMLPSLAVPESGFLVPLSLAGAKSALLLGGALLASRFLLPLLFFQVARTRSRELFLLLVVLLCFGTAWISGVVGLSLALGAFVAGIVVSDSEYSLQILSDALPFKDAFLAVFFISVGMLLDPGFVIWHPKSLVLVVVLVLVVNILVCTVAVAIFKYPLRVALFVGAALSQIGEFSFVLAQMGKDLGLIDQHLYQMTLAGTIVTMMVTPQLLRLGRAMPDWLLRLGVPERLVHGRADAALDTVVLRDHVIVCGYGPVGHHLCRVLEENGFPYLVLELNAARVQDLRDAGVQAYYGDSSSAEVLRQVGVHCARTVAVTYADPHAARRTVAQVKTLNPDVPVIARTRLPKDIAELRHLGADRVVEEESEVSLEMAAWTLRALGISRLAVDAEKAAIQDDDYRLFTEREAHLADLQNLVRTLPDVEIASFKVHPDSPWVGKTVGQVHLRSELGATLIAAVQGGEAVFNPGANFCIGAGDMLTLMGKRDDLTRVDEYAGARIGK